MEHVLKFEDLPNVVTMLTKEVSELKSLLTEKQEKPTNQPEQPLTVQEAAKFLNLAVDTIYTKVSRGELPVMKKDKRLYFLSSELMDYLRIGRVKTNLEIDQEANIYFSNKSGGRK